MVEPGEAHGPASSAFGAAVGAAVATLENTFYVQVSQFSRLRTLVVPVPVLEEGGLFF